MKKRLAKIIAVLLTLAVIVGALVTVASAENEAEVNLNVGDTYKSFSAPQSSNIAIVRALTGAAYENLEGYYRFVAGDGSVTTNSGGNHYVDLLSNPTKLETNWYDYFVLDFDIGADQWVTKDQSGNWTVLSEEAGEGARLSYPTKPLVFHFLTRFIGTTAEDAAAKVDYSQGKGGSAGQYSMSTVYDAATNSWKIKVGTAANAPTYPLSNAAGQSNHITIVLDLSDCAIEALAEAVTIADGTKLTHKLTGANAAKYHYFVDGNYVATVDNALNLPQDTMYVNTFYYDCIRHGYDATGKSSTYADAFSVCYDNLAINAYTESTGLDAVYANSVGSNLTSAEVATETLVYTSEYAKPAFGEIEEMAGYVVKTNNTAINWDTLNNIGSDTYMAIAKPTDVNGNKYLTLTRNAYLDALRNSRDIYQEFSFPYGANSTTYMSDFDYFIQTIDVSADKWVSKDANGKWTLLSDEATEGARPAYPSAMRIYPMARYYNSDGGLVWAINNGSNTLVNYSYDATEGQWYVNFGGTKLPVANEVGVWNQITLVFDASDIEFVGYTSEDAVAGAGDTVAYFKVADATKVRVYAYYNDAYLGTAACATTLTNDSKIRVNAAGNPDISFTGMRVNYGSNASNNESFSAGYDNYNAKLYTYGAALDAAFAGDAYPASLAEYATGLTGIDLSVPARYNNSTLPVADNEADEFSSYNGFAHGGSSGAFNKENALISFSGSTANTYKDKSGNYFFKMTRALASTETDKVAITGGPYFDYGIGKYDAAANWSLNNWKYGVFDISVMSDMYVDANGCLTATKTDRLAYNENLIMAPFYRSVISSGSKNNQNTFGVKFDYDETEKVWYIVDSKNANNRINIGNEAGNWLNITFIADMSDARIVYTLEEGGTTYDCSTLSQYGKLHAYVNGEYLTTWSNFFNLVNTGIVAGTNGPKIGFDAIRSTLVGGTDSTNYGMSVCVDDFRARYYASADAFADVAANPAAVNLYDNANAFVNVYNLTTDTYTVTATGTGAVTAVKSVFYNFDDAYAYANEIGAIAGYSNVTLAAPNNLPAREVNGAFSVASDYSFPWYSENYVLSDGAFVLATDEQKKTVTWKNGDETLVEETYTVGSTPFYKGAAVEDEELTNNFFDIAFKGFGDVEVVSADATYSAVYAPVADVQALFNLNTTTSFTARFLIPWFAEDETSLTVDGYEITELVVYSGAWDGTGEAPTANDLSTMTQTGGINPGYRFRTYEEVGGVRYRVATSSPAANGNNTVTYTVAFKVDGTLVTQTLSIDLITYFETILNGTYTEAEKSLMIHAVKYIRSVMTAANKTTDATKAFDDLLAQYASYLIADVDGAEFEAYIAGKKISNADTSLVTADCLEKVGFEINAGGADGYRPLFRFYAYEDQDIIDSITKVRIGYVVRNTDEISYVGTTKTTGTRTLEDKTTVVPTAYFTPGDTIPLYAYQDKIVIEVTVQVDAETTEVYTMDYSIMADIFADGNEAADVEKALYAYALASYNFKTNNVAKFDITK